MPVAALAQQPFDLPDEAATEALAARFAHGLIAWQLANPHNGGVQIHLHGDLGAGKTAFVRAVLRALGHAGRVRSPTYTLVEPYKMTLQKATPTSLPVPATPAPQTSPSPPSPMPDAELPANAAPVSLLVNHFDLYRFSDPAEWHEAGFDEYLGGQAINMIEWPSRAAEALGTPDLLLNIVIASDARATNERLNARVLTAQAFTPAGIHCLSEVSR